MSENEMERTLQEEAALENLASAVAAVITDEQLKKMVALVCWMPLKMEVLMKQ